MDAGKSTARALLIATLVLGASLLRQARAGGQRPMRPGLIDVHCHLHGLARFQRGNAFEAAARTALRSMDEHGIATMVVMPPPFFENHPARVTAWLPRARSNRARD